MQVSTRRKIGRTMGPRTLLYTVLGRPRLRPPAALLCSPRRRPPQSPRAGSRTTRRRTRRCRGSAPATGSSGATPRGVARLRARPTPRRAAPRRPPRLCAPAHAPSRGGGRTTAAGARTRAEPEQTGTHAHTRARGHNDLSQLLDYGGVRRGIEVPAPKHQSSLAGRPSQSLDVSPAPSDLLHACAVRGTRSRRVTSGWATGATDDSQSSAMGTRKTTIRTVHCYRRCTVDQGAS